MVRVLCIGQYNDEGKFYNEQWKCFIEWCKIVCNKIVIYSRMTYRMVCSKFPLYCKISTLDKVDKDMDVYAYRMDIIDDKIWNYIKHYNYNIDINDIDYIFFYHKETYLASLEIVDYENYIFIETFFDGKSKLLLNREMLEKNIRLCYKGKADIDEALQEECWKPLGE